MAAKTGKPNVKVCGVCGKTEQAVAEAQFAEEAGYHACLLSLAAMKEDLLTSQSQLKSFLRINFPEWFDDASGNIVRDNDNHTGFFAM